MGGIEDLWRRRRRSNGAGPVPLEDVAPRTLDRSSRRSSAGSTCPTPAWSSSPRPLWPRTCSPATRSGRLLVGPPGAGKSEALQSTIRLPQVLPGRRRSPRPRCSQARRTATVRRMRRADCCATIGDFGIIVCKDFGSVLLDEPGRPSGGARGAARDLRRRLDPARRHRRRPDALAGRARSGSSAAARRRSTATTRSWARWANASLLYRLPEVDADEQARRALAHAGREEAMRARARRRQSPACSPRDCRTRRASSVTPTTRAARLARHARRALPAAPSSVTATRREIELVPGSEAPTRLVIVLDRLLAGLDAIGLDRPTAWSVVTKVRARLDPSASALRCSRALAERAGEPTTSELAEAVSHPTATTRRALEDLTAHGVVERHSHGQGKAATWSLPSWTRERYERAMTFSEMSGRGQSGTSTHEKSDAGPSYLSPLSTKEDISEKVGGDAYEQRAKALGVPAYDDGRRP